MKIAILSDTHNEDERIVQALELARSRGAELIIHCGDIEDAPIIQLFRGWDAHFVFGNCDWDRDGLEHAIREIGATLHENYGHLEIRGRTLGFTHGHHSDLLKELEQSGVYDYVFHGHTHIAVDKKSGRTRVINPGALHRANVKTFVVLDPESGETESVVVR